MADSPTYAKFYGWAYILYLMNQAFLAYWYPERLFGEWRSVGPWYNV